MGITIECKNSNFGIRLVVGRLTLSPLARAKRTAVQFLVAWHSFVRVGLKTIDLSGGTGLNIAYIS